jgi:hypothetical protein
MFGNHYGLSGAKSSKPDMCRLTGAEAIIDDAVEYAAQCAKSGINAVLFENYPWNESKGQLPAGVTRLLGWGAVVKYFLMQP